MLYIFFNVLFELKKYFFNFLIFLNFYLFYVNYNVNIWCLGIKSNSYNVKNNALKEYRIMILMKEKVNNTNHESKACVFVFVVR